MMRDKALDDESPGSLTHHVFRQTHTTRHGTIDQHTDGTGVRERHVVECLHEDAQGPHQQGCDREGQDDTGRIEIGEIVMGKQVRSEMGNQRQT